MALPHLQNLQTLTFVEFDMIFMVTATSLMVDLTTLMVDLSSGWCRSFKKKMLKLYFYGSTYHHLTILRVHHRSVLNGLCVITKIKFHYGDFRFSEPYCY